MLKTYHFKFKIEKLSRQILMNFNFQIWKLKCRLRHSQLFKLIKKNFAIFSSKNSRKKFQFSSKKKIFRQSQRVQKIFFIIIFYRHVKLRQSCEQQTVIPEIKVHTSHTLKIISSKKKNELSKINLLVLIGKS